MRYPRVQSAKVIDDHTLLVEFKNHQKRKYDITPLLEKEIFSPLKNPAFFKNVRVEKGGYAVCWNNEIDISEYELWIHRCQKPLSIGERDFAEIKVYRAHGARYASLPPTQ